MKYFQKHSYYNCEVVTETKTEPIPQPWGPEMRSAGQGEIKNERIEEKLEETLQAEGGHVQKPWSTGRLVQMCSPSKDFGLYPKSKEEFLRLFYFLFLAKE